MPGHGNGKDEVGRESGAVPRWVRVLLDQHEARMAQMGRIREEVRAKHEARMSRMDRQISIQEKRLARLEEDRRGFVAEIARLDAQPARDGRALVDALKSIHGRVSRQEGRR